MSFFYTRLFIFYYLKFVVKRRTLALKPRPLKLKDTFIKKKVINEYYFLKTIKKNSTIFFNKFTSIIKLEIYKEMFLDFTRHINRNKFVLLY